MSKLSWLVLYSNLQYKMDFLVCLTTLLYSLFSLSSTLYIVVRSWIDCLCTPNRCKNSEKKIRLRKYQIRNRILPDKKQPLFLLSKIRNLGQYIWKWHRLRIRSKYPDPKPCPPPSVTVCVMVIILDGSSEIGTHTSNNLCYLICLRHLIRSVSSHKSDFFFSKNMSRK